jgi:toxin ParE1/3/4
VRVRFTPFAHKQLLGAIGHLHRENRTAACAFRHKAHKALARWRRFPQSGRVLPELPDLPFREVIVAPYRFFCRVKDRTVWIVVVWHGAQLPEEPHEIDET